MSSGRRLLVAATGGVAAVKTPALLRRLAEVGHQVRVAASEDAYRFVTPLALAVAAGSEVFDRRLWFRPDGHARHIELARWADALVVAPATANALASAAGGRADDVVSALVVSGVPKVVWVPAMNSSMWKNAAVQRNVRTLERDGHHLLGPVVGRLAARGEGPGVGRMMEPEDIVQALEGCWRSPDYRGRRVLVSAGPTREYLDPVRFLSNPSSGRMGYAVAAAARDRAAQVTLVTGPTSLKPPERVRLVEVVSAGEMLAALRQEFERADLLVMTAAVADWRASEIASQKEPKQGNGRTLELVRTVDILQLLAGERSHQVMVGFAMETDRGVERAAAKARRKGLDFICLNYPTRGASAFGGDTT